MKRIILFVVMAVLVLGQNPAPDTTPEHFLVTGSTNNTVSIAALTAPIALSIYDHDKMVMTIAMKDGKVTFGEGITPDEATKQFVIALAKQWSSAFCAEIK